MARFECLAALVQFLESNFKVGPRLPLPTSDHVVVLLEMKIDCCFMRRRCTALKEN